MDDISLTSGAPGHEPASKGPGVTIDVVDPSDSKVHAAKFSTKRKIHVVVAGLACAFNGSFGTSMPSGALNAISSHFGVYDQVQLTLLNSLNLAGFVVGPLFFGPLSEYIGRRPVMISTFFGYLVFMLACSGAPNYTALLIFRLLCGLNAAAPMAVIGGLYADVLDDPSERGTAMSLYLAISGIGPLLGPFVSGFASQASWRWAFWAAALIAVPTLPLVLTLPETFAPVLRNREIHKRRKHGVEGVEEAQMTELHPFDAREIFLRPVVMMATEPILSLSSLYLTLANSLFYISFQAYPLVFEGMYHLRTEIAGLTYLPIALGSVIAFLGFMVYTPWYDRSKAAGKSWAQREINRRLPIACFAAPLLVIALFCFGWTSKPSISPYVPAIGGFFSGAGFLLIFMSILNYITDVFREASASAHAGAGCMRSLGAIVIPLAAGPMYDRLGVHWAQSLLGFLSLVMGAIPFFFMKYGERLMQKSKAAQGITR
ncbi:MFS domain-containing protein [Fusarium falciforme]|uniref:MFS domain-containing protein n=1 Tax=Fusarium falciforme TaxID=195108 RepID=UPI00230000A0|nr:MFS domain-containing protein [Fusarium falciforme]WAO91117.1 MFS domain-containing protein [Fusarium falciforme]